VANPRDTSGLDIWIGGTTAFEVVPSKNQSHDATSVYAAGKPLPQKPQGPKEVKLRGKGFADGDAFGAGIVAAGTVEQNLGGGGFADGDAFGAGTVTASRNLAGAGFADADSW